MRESVLKYIVVCPKCRRSYMPRMGEVCDCPPPNTTHGTRKAAKQ